MSKKDVKNNQNRRLMIILLAVTCLCVAFFVIATAVTCSKDGFKKEIVLVQDGTTVDSMQIKDLSVHPGKSVDYQVYLKTGVTGSYRVQMNFKEKVDGGLKQFIVASVKSNQLVVLEEKLDKVLSDKIVVFNCNITADKPYVLDIKYLMPEQTGNEAMGTNASFDIEFTIDMV